MLLLVREAAACALIGGCIGGCIGVAVYRRILQRNRPWRRGLTPDHVVPYNPPSWLPSGVNCPVERLCLGHLPTPIHQWRLPGLDGMTVFIKRDDYTGSELSGNKVRKLEFLLAEALAQGCDSVITVGGVQSNHCRATAVAARRVGLEPHIILRVPRADVDPGLSGNLLLDRLAGAHLRLVDEARYESAGGAALVLELQEELRAAGRRPYSFPSGGSNDVGSWGYVECVAELERQLAASDQQGGFDRLYFACGSGGTAAGLALGMHLSGLSRRTELVGLCVDDSPSFFHSKIDGVLRAMGAQLRSRDAIHLVDAVGAGYAQSTDEELRFIVAVARASGVVLDTVYSGKAALGMARDLEARPAKRSLFLHTGGLHGLFAREEELAPLLLP